MALLYRSCALSFGWSPEQVDEMELWQIAAAFDEVLLPVDGGGDAGSSVVAPVPSGTVERDLVAERVAHAAGRGPRPEADPATPGTLGLMNQFRRSGGDEATPG